MYEKNSYPRTKNRYLKGSFLAIALASFALNQSEAQSRPQIDKAMTHPMSLDISKMSGAIALAESHNSTQADPQPNMESHYGKIKVPKKYWYGPKSELHVVKQLGNKENAVLAHKIAFKQPWYSKKQMYCTDRLWYRESKFDEHADNPNSAAYGIPQANPGSKMASAGGNWANSPTVQIKWGFNHYIEKRYKVPCNAWNHSQAYGWY